MYEMSQTVFLYNKANTYGLLEDVKLLTKLSQTQTNNIRHADPLEPPSACDLAVHFEVPYYGWLPWARRNVFVVNPEWWEPAWNSYLSKCDALIFKCAEDARSFFNSLPETASHPPSFVLPWTSPVPISDFHQNSGSDAILWLLGASANKRAAAQKILPLWKPEYPQLNVYTVEPLSCESLSANVTITVGDLSEETRRTVQSSHPAHLIFSQAEALGLAAHEGQMAGAFLIGNALPTYLEAFNGADNVHLSPASLEGFKAGVRDSFERFTSETLDAAMAAFQNRTADCSKVQKSLALARLVKFYKMADEAFKVISYGDAKIPEGTALPPRLPETTPHISIVTLLHNRRRFIDLALHNLLITDYPKDKIEWVIIEDSDIPEEQGSDKIMKFARECAPLSVTYIPLDKKNVPIGSMRNRAIKKAQHDIILFMDDDDHYPPTSFRRRVAWLTEHPHKPQAVSCTTIACYDLVKGTSAVNTPPWSLGLKSRISEATLCFYKSWWAAKPFPTVSMAEGEGFLEGREDKVLELAPQQIIVAMSHGKNASSRRIPESGKPSCFWGFPKEFLVFLHKLAGIDVEEL